MVRHAAILERVIEPGQGNLPADLARYLLQLDFPPADHQRYAALAAKAQEGTLTPAEQAELDDYLNADTVLSMIQSKARRSLPQSVRDELTENAAVADNLAMIDRSLDDIKAGRLQDARQAICDIAARHGITLKR